MHLLTLLALLLNNDLITPKIFQPKTFYSPVSAEYIQLTTFWCISSYGPFELWLNKTIKCDCTQHRSCIKPPNTNTLFAQTLTLTFLLTHRVGLNVFTEESQSHAHISIINLYAFEEPLSILWCNRQEFTESGLKYAVLRKNVCFKMVIYIFCFSVPVGNINFRFPNRSLCGPSVVGLFVHTKSLLDVDLSRKV